MLKLGVLAICLMNGFPGFPAKVKGDVVISLKNYITIAVQNKEKTELVEMTFPKNKCTKDK